MAADVFSLLGEINRTYGVTVVIVTHYPGVVRYVDRVVHIRDGRISSESFLQSTFQRSGANVEQEFLVIDQAGRLQLPQEYLAELQLNGLAVADVEGDQITLKAAQRRPQRRPE